MIELHPEFLTKNGKNFAILPYEEFIKIKELSNISSGENDITLQVDITTNILEVSGFPLELSKSSNPITEINKNIKPRDII